jgi:hypothetical protein
MAEDNEAGLEGARERLAAEDLAVAALLAAGDPAADLAARALAVNGGSLARALVGVARALLDRERYVSRGLLRGA